MTTHNFVVGTAYNRRTDIHAVYRGQQQGGVSTPAKFPFVFAFTGEAGTAFGYKDGFQADGAYWYTGEGQVGDMKMSAGNAAIHDHAKNGKALLLFQNESKGMVRFIGSAHCLGSHIEQRPDRNGDTRNAIVFHLAIESASQEAVAGPPDEVAPTERQIRGLPLKELKQLALRTPPGDASPETRLVNLWVRSTAVRVYALKRADGTCEGCQTPAPFHSRQGPFLEVHHLFRLADGGPDNPSNVAALCPNCHRRAHYAVDGGAFNQSLIQLVRGLET